MFGHLKIAYVFVLIFIILCCCAGDREQDSLTVNLGKPIRYRSDDGQIFTARYGSLSDNSLNFVKVTMPDGTEFTLPQAISASGARYTDERGLVWWTHQGTALVEARDDDGDWIIIHSGLQELSAGN